MPSLSEMAKEAKKKSKAPPPKKSAPRGFAGVFKSSERVADSDMDSDTESESDSDSEPELPKVASKPIAATNGVNGHKKVVSAKPENASDSSSSEDDDSSGSDDEESSGSGSSSGEGEDSDSDEESLPQKVPTKAVSAGKPTNPAPIVSVRAEQIAPYIPPSGFELVASSRQAVTTTSRIFSNQNLAGKQVWYITAPASVPISAIKQVSLKDVHSGKPSVTIKGEKYGFVEDKVEDAGKAKVLLPDSSSSTYRMAKRSIDQTLHLQQIVELPTFSSGTSSQTASTQSSSRATVPAKRPVRQQPEGLKMRFLPIGSSSTGSVKAGLGKSFGIISTTGNRDSDSEMEDAPPTFKKPLKLAETEDEDSTTSEDESSSDDKEVEIGKKIISKTVAAVDNSSTESSEESSEEDVPTKILPPKSIPASKQPSLKRKLSDLHDSNSHSSLSQSPNLNGKQLKKIKLNPIISPIPNPVRSMSNKANGAPKSTMSPPSSSNTFKHATLTSILPPKPPKAQTKESLTNGSIKLSSIPPPRSILPSPRPSTKSSTVGSIVYNSGSESGQSRSLARSPELLSKPRKAVLAEDTSPSLEPSLTEEQRRKEKKRLKKSKASKEARHEADTSERYSPDPSSSQTLQPSSVIKPPSKPSLTKIDSHDKTSSWNGDQKRPPASTTKTKQHKARKDEIPPNENGRPSPIRSSVTPIPPPKMKTTILPQKSKSSGSI